MTSPFRVVVVALLVAVLGEGVADACRLSTDLKPSPCQRWKNARRQAPHGVVVVSYARVRRHRPPPFGMKRTTRFLVGSTWAPLARKVTTGGEGGDERTLRFATADRARRHVPEDQRQVLVRELVEQDGQAYVAVDDAWFVLQPCEDDRGRRTACLVLGGPPAPR